MTNLRRPTASRMSWLRDLLKEIANNIQIIVFTCQPDNYLIPAGGRTDQARRWTVACARGQSRAVYRKVRCAIGVEMI